MSFQGPLQIVRDTLNEFASGLHLGEEALPSVFDAGLMDTALALEDLVASEFSMHLAKRAVALRLAARILVEDPAPDAMALVLSEFRGLTVEMGMELRPHPLASEWHMARQFAEISEHLAGPSPAENQGFRELPKLLIECDWVRREFEKLAGASDVVLERTPASRGFSKQAAKRWVQKTLRYGEGQLCAALDHLLNAIEYRARQVWYLRRTGGEERPLPQLYVDAHWELFPDFHGGRGAKELELETAKLRGLSLGLQLPEFALCLESAEWMSQYALNHLLPPAPGEWAVRQAGQLARLLNARLARWYSRAFDYTMEPLELAAGVLRIGRPLFYERIAAHALLEYSLLQGVPFTRQAAPFYVEALPALEREFERLVDGYLLRLMHYPKLKTPQGWCAYLQAVVRLHFGDGRDEELDAFRHVFLTRRGLRSAVEILYRATAGHGPVN